jgi:hypothetical protein
MPPKGKAYPRHPRAVVLQGTRLINRETPWRIEQLARVQMHAKARRENEAAANAARELSNIVGKHAMNPSLTRAEVHMLAKRDFARLKKQ